MATKLTNTIILDHRHRADKQGREQLEIRITWDRKSYYIATGIKVRPQEWAAGRIVNCIGAKEMNDQLSIIYSRAMELVNGYLRENQVPDIEQIKSEVWSLAETERCACTMMEWMEEQIPKLNIVESTRKHYWTVIKILKSYGRMTRWKDVTVARIYDYDAWLHQQKRSDGRAICQATVHNYHKYLKALLHRAYLFGIIESNPYDKLTGKFDKGEKESVEYLTEPEMNAIVDLELPEGSILDKVRDLFVFQMYTGLSYSDSQKFDIGQYKFDGERWIHTGERVKTGVPYVSSLLPPVIAVLEKYGMKTPKINNADYNHHLKAIGLLAGIRTKMHSHLARHTFATWMLSNDVAIQNVSRMLGHKNIQQTMRYAKVLAQSVHDDFDKMAEKMKKG